MSFVDKIALNLGYIKEDEFLYKSLPPNSKRSIDERLKKLNDIEFLSNVEAASKEISALRRDYEDQVKFLPGVNRQAVSGYSAAGSVLRRMYPNPFALFAFIGENHWAAVKARRHNRIEFERDKYVFVTAPGVAKKDVKKVQQGLEDLGFPAFRSDLFDHIKTFGNFWVMRDSNMLGGVNGLDLLLPERLLPIYKFDDIVGWEYTWNNQRLVLSLDQVDHVKTYSLRSPTLGSPTLSSAVVDIEADLHASVYNNTLWQKGGLIKAIIALDPMEGDGINPNAFVSFAQVLQDIFSKQHAGVRGAGELLFSPNVRGVHQVMNPKDLEGANKETSEKTAIKVCELLGCPPEVLGLSRSSQYVNKASIMDFASMSIDNDNYYCASLVDKFINEVIIEEIMGVEGVYIQQSGEFGAVAAMAADFAFKISQSGADIITVNEFRTKVLHWEPLPGSEGEQFLGKYKNEALLIKAATPTTSSKEQKEILEKLFGAQHQSAPSQEFKKYTLEDLRFYKG